MPEREAWKPDCQTGCFRAIFVSIREILKFNYLSNIKLSITMKKSFFYPFALLFLASTIFIGCGSDPIDPPDPPEPPPPPPPVEYIVVADEETLNQTVYADEETGASIIEFSTITSWTSSINEEPTTQSTRDASELWASISPSSGGAGDHEIEITLEPNLTGADRTIIITITSGDATIEIRITQRYVREGGIAMSYKVVTLSEAGTLPDLLSATDKEVVTNLTVIGEINGTDIRLIREMTQITFLDLSEARIVEGGDAYLFFGQTPLYTTNDVIGNNMFRSRGNLTEIILPNSITTIGDWAFSGTPITSVTIPNSVTTIGTWAFNNTSLTSIDIPNSVETIGTWALAVNFRLTSVTLSNSITTIPDHLFAVTALTSFTVPEGVISIGTGAFLSSFYLRYVTIPASVTNISRGAFGFVEIDAIRFSVSSPLLEAIYLEGTTPPEGWGGFSSPFSTEGWWYPYETITLYVPKGSYGYYRRHGYWRRFKNIVEVDR